MIVDSTPEKDGVFYILAIVLKGIHSRFQIVDSFAYGDLNDRIPEDCCRLQDLPQFFSCDNPKWRLTCEWQVVIPMVATIHVSNL